MGITRAGEAVGGLIVSLLVESYIVLFKPLLDVLVRVASLQIQLYCLFSQSSLFGSLLGACVRICISTFLGLCLVLSRCCCTGLFLAVRCSRSLCLHGLLVYPTYCVLHEGLLHVSRYIMFFEEQL